MAIAKAANDYMCIYEKFVAGPSRGRKGGTYGHRRLMLQLKKDIKLSRKLISIIRCANTFAEFVSLVMKACIALYCTLIDSPI